MVEALFLDEGPILTNGAKPIGGTFIDKFGEVEIWSRVLTGPTPFSGQLLPLTRHMCRGGGGGGSKPPKHQGVHRGRMAQSMPLPSDLDK